MKKVIIGIVIAVIVLVAVYFLLPENMKLMLEYYKMQIFDKETYAEIQVVQDTKVLHQDALTYGQIMDAVVSHQYWTYEDNVSANGTYQKTITANGDNVTLTLGESGDSGVYDNSELQFVFILDSMGGYDLNAYIDGTQLSKEDRDSLLERMCKMAD